MRSVGDKLIKVSLISMILLSLVLSWKIWTKPSNHRLEDANHKANDIIQKKKVTDVYVPTKLFYRKDKTVTMYTNRESLISNIQQELTQLGFKDGHSLNRTEINQLIATPFRNIDLSFPTELPIGFYLENYQLDVRESTNVDHLKFSRIVIDLDNHKLYFANRNKEMLAVFTIDGDLSKFDKLLDDKQTNYYDVEMTRNNLADVYYLTKESKLKTYSYIVATQSFTTFSKAFFYQSEDLFSSEGGDDVNLSNGEGESLTIQSRNGEVNYFGKLQNTSNDLYSNTFRYVENLGSTLGTIRYFDNTGSDITYRNYVEGFPVFGEDFKGTLDITVQNQKNVHIATNQETIQIPIPSEETVSLPPTQQMIDELESLGIDKGKIKDIQIGYEWQSNSDTRQVVDLVPKWYLKYDGEWQSSEQVKRLLQVKEPFREGRDD